MRYTIAAIANTAAEIADQLINGTRSTSAISARKSEENK